MVNSSLPWLTFSSVTSTNEDVISRDSAEGLNDRAVRQVYLITYRKAGLQKCPTQESFAQAVVKSFEVTNTKIECWVCCKEAHQVNGCLQKGILKKITVYQRTSPICTTTITVP